MKRILILSGVLLDIVVAAVLYPRECLHFGWALLTGWIGFLRRVAPQVHVNWSGVATGVVFVVLLFALLQLFARWFHAAAARAPTPDRRWRFRWTLSAMLALFVMFAAGYSSIGLARHVGWLCSSPDRMLDAKEIRHYKVRLY